MTDSMTFRRAWGKFATGVAVVTSIESDGHVHGMAANGINSVSLDPQVVLVCVAHDRNSYPLIKEKRRFAINILSDDQRHIAEYFAQPMELRTGGVEISFSFTERGSAVLDVCLAYMDCHVVNEYVVGDHTVFFGGVDEIQLNTGNPLIFFEGEFRRLAQW